ncbi:MAG: lipolytic enzyme family [Bryobacterales bacterium]|nr:lipolytic enzyme family [Bryobacterales bacterium]
MNLLRRSFLAVCALAASCASSPAQDLPPYYLHSGDRVVFYGDSITEQRLYTMLTELYGVTRYPKLDVTYVHSGWGGDRVTGGGGGTIDARLARDVFAYKPTVVTIMLGMNDGKYTNHTPADDEIFFKGFRHIVESLKQNAPGVRITALEPSPFDDVTRPIGLQPSGYNAVLVNYSDWIRKYAAENKMDVADLNAPVVSMLRKANAAEPELAQKIIPDRIHPSISGHLIMAEQLLKSWNARPLVSRVTIDAAAGKVTASEFARVTDFHAGDSLTWTELDESLPLPFVQLLAGDRDKTLALAIASSDITEALNEQPLQITGLKPGKYNLSIDGETVGTWPDSDFAKGVNLAVLSTPMSIQAMEVRDWTVRHIDIHQFRWRTLQVPLQDSGIDNAGESMKNLDATEAGVVARQRAAAQPKPHVYKLTSVQ